MECLSDGLTDTPRVKINDFLVSENRHRLRSLLTDTSDGDRKLTLLSDGRARGRGTGKTSKGGWSKSQKKKSAFLSTDCCEMHSPLRYHRRLEKHKKLRLEPRNLK